MEYIADDIAKIQMKTGMYISYVGKKGALHLAKEVIQNAIDECANPKSPAKNIEITLDTGIDTLTVEDDGRGIPETEFPMDILCTKLNSGSKFTREQGGSSSGENGTGLTAVNALSTSFVWSSYRDGKVHTIEFKDGKKIKDTTKKSSKEHGTICKFSPSKKYLGKSAEIPKKDLIQWVENISYFIPKNSKIRLDIVKDGKSIESFKYKPKTITELLKSHVVDNKLSQVFTFSGNTHVKEDFRGERTIDRELSIEFSFVYTDSIEPWVDSYCNYVNTTSGGVHLETVRECLWRFLMKKTTDSLTETEKNKYKILKVDVEAGLNIVVNLFTTMQMQFVGQTKNEVSNDDLIEPIKSICNERLESYFSENKSELTVLTKLIKVNCKARLDASKIKAATIKETVNKFDKYKVEKFTPCNNEGKAYKELFICEGDSAAGSIIDGRDPDTQAVIAFRGVTANGFKRDASTILNNKEWYNYVKVIKTNFGPKFDLSKCYYDKIIISTDADVDGHNITSGIGAFHALYMPEIVMAGKLYKAVPPLYELDDKKHPFARDKQEYISLYQDKIVKNYEVALGTGKKAKALTGTKFKDFIYNTEAYPEELERIAKHFSINKFLIEIVAAFIILNDIKDDDTLFSGKTLVKFLEAIQSKFPEIIIKDGTNTLRGPIDGKYQSVAINDRFFRKIDDIRPIIEEYGYSLTVSENGSPKKEMSIGEFLDDASKYKIKIIRRFKGLGEATSKQLWDTTLNPDTRILIQLTMDDVMKDLKTFEKIHGQGKLDLAARKVMMAAYKIKREDLDN